jgi:hypothetical protein
MALVVKDRVKETTSTTGTGTLTLGGAVTGFQTFTSVLSNSDTTYYAIFESSTGQFEVGLGTFTSSGTTLARTTILESSNSGNAINLTAGSADVFITQPAEKAVYLDASGHIAAADGRNVTNVAASTAATLATARDIGGVSFDGSASINLPGVNTSGNQDTSGNAATATTLETARNIGGVSFDGSANIDLPGVNATGNQNTTGNAGTASQLYLNESSDNSYSANILFDATGAAGNRYGTVYMDDGGLTFNPSTNSFYCSNASHDNVYVADRIYHSSDTNSYIQWGAADDFSIFVGGRQILRCDEGTNPDKIQFFDSSNFINTDGDFEVTGNITISSGNLTFSDGSSQTSAGASTGKAIAMAIVFG